MCGDVSLHQQWWGAETNARGFHLCSCTREWKFGVACVASRGCESCGRHPGVILEDSV